MAGNFTSAPSGTRPRLWEPGAISSGVGDGNIALTGFSIPMPLR